MPAADSADAAHRCNRSWPGRRKNISRFPCGCPERQIPLGATRPSKPPLCVLGSHVHLIVDAEGGTNLSRGLPRTWLLAGDWQRNPSRPGRREEYLPISMFPARPGHLAMPNLARSTPRCACSRRLQSAQPLPLPRARAGVLAGPGAARSAAIHFAVPGNDVHLNDVHLIVEPKDSGSSPFASAESSDPPLAQTSSRSRGRGCSP
jgi:hypothetical protein